ncbi:hypothetical protein D3C76_1099660 [compost metagenome]
MLAIQAWHDDGAHITQHNVAQLQPVDPGSITLGATVGGAQGHPEALFQFQPFGHLRRDRHIGRPGIEHEIHRLAIDMAAGNEMPLAIAHQFHLDETLAAFRADDHIRILLTLFPLAEKPRGQKQSGAPGQYHQYPTGTFARRLLAHDLALQPPSGTAKRQTIGRTSPSARAPVLLSMPIQAPSASTIKASVRAKSWG